MFSSNGGGGGDSLVGTVVVVGVNERPDMCVRYFTSPDIDTR